jgi:hypothetical protein
MPRIYLGPPMSGFRAFFSPSQPGAWSVARPYPSNGQVVLQMGVNGPQEHPEGIGCSAGFERDIAPERDGDHTFHVTIQAGPITMLPRGAFNIFAQVVVFVSGRDVFKQAFWAFPAGPYVGAQFGTRTLTVIAPLLTTRTYTFTIENRIHMDYPGVPSPAPYAEIIATSRAVEMITPRVLTEAPDEEEVLDERVERALARNKRRVREYSDEEMASGEPIILK